MTGSTVVQAVLQEPPRAAPVDRAREGNNSGAALKSFMVCPTMKCKNDATIQQMMLAIKELQGFDRIRKLVNNDQTMYNLLHKEPEEKHSQRKLDNVPLSALESIDTTVRLLETQLRQITLEADPTNVAQIRARMPATQVNFLAADGETVDHRVVLDSFVSRVRELMALPESGEGEVCLAWRSLSSLAPREGDVVYPKLKIFRPASIVQWLLDIETGFDIWCSLKTIRTRAPAPTLKTVQNVDADISSLIRGYVGVLKSINFPGSKPGHLDEDYEREVRSGGYGNQTLGRLIELVKNCAVFKNLDSAARPTASDESTTPIGNGNSNKTDTKTDLDRRAAVKALTADSGVSPERLHMFLNQERNKPGGVALSKKEREAAGALPTMPPAGGNKNMTCGADGCGSILTNHNKDLHARWDKKLDEKHPGADFKIGHCPACSGCHRITLDGKSVGCPNDLAKEEGYVCQDHQKTWTCFYGKPQKKKGSGKGSDSNWRRPSGENPIVPLDKRDPNKTYDAEGRLAKSLRPSVKMIQKTTTRDYDACPYTGNFVAFEIEGMNGTRWADIDSGDTFGNIMCPRQWEQLISEAGTNSSSITQGPSINATAGQFTNGAPQIEISGSCNIATRYVDKNDSSKWITTMTTFLIAKSPCSTPFTLCQQEGIKIGALTDPKDMVLRGGVRPRTSEAANLDHLDLPRLKFCAPSGVPLHRVLPHHVCSTKPVHDFDTIAPGESVDVQIQIPLQYAIGTGFLLAEPSLLNSKYFTPTTVRQRLRAGEMPALVVTVTNESNSHVSATLE